MRENVTISYRGAGYEIGRGEHFYGIWAASSSQPQPLEWWPATPEGWAAAWARFTSIETPGTIVPVGQAVAPGTAAPAGGAGFAGPSGGAGSGGAGSGGPGSGGPGFGVPVSGDVLASGPADAGPIFGRDRRTVLAVALLAVGVVVGFVGLFPSYLSGASLASQPDQLVPHLIYLAGWAASAVLLFLGGARWRIGALLGAGLSAVTLGLFFADAGTAIADGSGVMGAGLVLGLIGWACCAAGSAVAFATRRAGGFGRPHSDDMGPIVMLVLAAIGTAAAFAPSWDSFTLRNAAGVSQTLTEGNAFSNPAAVITGDVLVMVAVVAVVAAAALWRPLRLGAALLAGAIIPMAAQAISALIQVGETVSPTQFGITPGQASQIGLTINSGLTSAFWIYCAFLVALIASFAWMLIPPHNAVRQPPRMPQGPPAGMSDTPPATSDAPPAVSDAPTEVSDANRSETADSVETVEATSVRPPTP
ncbi:MAG TPA: hypothetical protein VMC03_23615 [Streptosporangiaceae bacterium]|nr:hypothetical protein [Streptosporangiaceae bacterium]